MSDDWHRWLSEQIMAIRHTLGHMDARLTALERRTKRRRQELGWLRELPWRPILLATAGGVMLLTGHLSVGEIKAWMSPR